MISPRFFPIFHQFSLFYRLNGHNGDHVGFYNSCIHLYFLLGANCERIQWFDQQVGGTDIKNQGNSGDVCLKSTDDSFFICSYDDKLYEDIRLDLKHMPTN